MIKRNLLKNKDWNPSLIITLILLSFLISLYVLIDVDKSTETLGYLYQAASIKLENIYELGAFAVIVFLLIFNPQFKMGPSCIINPKKPRT